MKRFEVFSRGKTRHSLIFSSKYKLFILIACVVYTFHSGNPLSLQKLLFLDTAEGVASTLRPYWAAATADRASVVQAQPNMLEIVPPGTSKGSGVRILLDHLGATPDEVCLAHPNNLNC